VFAAQTASFEGVLSALMIDVEASIFVISLKGIPSINANIRDRLKKSARSPANQRDNYPILDAD
jgi:hypothetical protein